MSPYLPPFIPSNHPTNFNRYAEMEKIEKHKISHRFRALEKLKTWLQAEV
jgi:inosine triphosphate pyrophosphatase